MWAECGVLKTIFISEGVPLLRDEGSLEVPLRQMVLLGGQ